MFTWLGFWKKETEEEKWRNLEETMKRVMFGQHIAVGEVLSYLRIHFLKENPSKALVIICNGSLGTGKTHFANMVAKNIFTSGEQRTCVKLFVGPRDFPDSQRVSEYQDHLMKTIEAQVKRNPRTFFIFDEVDKMPVNLLDVVSPYVDRYDKIAGIDYRKCIFLFLSNTGGKQIDNIVLQQAREKKNRKDLLLYHFNKTLQNIVYNETGGLQGSAIISKRLIDHYVPFLPLERSHIIECLEVEYQQIQKSFLHPVDLREVAELFDYYPEDNPIFSEEGAKNVYIKILYAREFINKNLPIPKNQEQTSDTEMESLANGIALLE